MNEFDCNTAPKPNKLRKEESFKSGEILKYQLAQIL